MTKKRYIVNFAIILILATITGWFAGNYYVRNFTGGVEAVSVSEETVRDDMAPILKKATGKNPEFLTATENFILAEYYLNQKAAVKKSTTGEINAGITQTLMAIKVLQDNQYFSQRISASSMVKVAERFYYTKDAESVYLHKGDNITSTSATFNATPNETINLATFDERYGTNPKGFINYVVSSKTVVHQTDVTKNSSGNYTATLDLDNYYSVMNYMYELRTTAGSDKFPQFESIKLTFEIDSNWNLIKMSVEEKYKVKVPVLGFTSCVATVEDVFSYDGGFVIP